MGILFIYDHTFTKKRWIETPRERVKIVDDMLRKNKLVGKSKEYVIELLGKPTKTNYFKEDNNIVYYLGDERGFFSIDSEWLVIFFENDIIFNRKFQSKNADFPRS